MFGFHIGKTAMKIYSSQASNYNVSYVVNKRFLGK